MSNTSNFRDAINSAKTKALVGPNVIANALPYVGGGLVLTAAGTYGGLMVRQNNPALFFPTFIAAFVVELILFFIAQNVAQKANNQVALPLLTAYSLLSGYTLSGIVALALGTRGVGIYGVAFAALGCGVTFIIGRQVGSNLSESDGMALSKTIGLGLVALLVVIVVQVLFSVFGVYTPNWLEIAISGIGVFLFIGAAVVDFFVLPRAYRDEQYLAAALSMYLTYHQFVYLHFAVTYSFKSKIIFNLLPRSVTE